MSTSLTKALVPRDNNKDESKSPLPLIASNSVFVAPKGGGKTTVILNLLTKKESPWYKHFSMIFYVSCTMRNDPKLATLLEDIGEDQCYDTINNATIERIQSQIEEYKSENPDEKKPQFCVVYDDCVHLLRNKDSKKVREMVSQNRHWGVSNIFLIQRWKGIDPLIRNNLDLFFLWKSNNKKEIQGIFDEINFDEDKLRKLYEYATEKPYGFLLVNAYKQPVRFFSKFDPIQLKKKEKNSII